MTADLTPSEPSAEAPAAPAWPDPATTRPARRTPRVVGLLFALFLGLLGVITLTSTALPVNAGYPHSLRSVLGEGCGGG